MSSVDGSRGGSKVDPAASRSGGDWKGQQRDYGPHAYPVSTAGGTPDPGSSLRARIGEKEAARSAPQAPTTSYRSDMLHKDDERDNRKRTATGELIARQFLDRIYLTCTQTGIRTLGRPTASREVI